MCRASGFWGVFGVFSTSKSDDFDVFLMDFIGFHRVLGVRAEDFAA